MHPRQPRLHPRAGKRGRAEEQAAVLCRGARLPLRQADPGQHQDPDQKCAEGELNSFATSVKPLQKLCHFMTSLSLLLTP